MLEMWKYLLFIYLRMEASNPILIDSIFNINVWVVNEHRMNHVLCQQNKYVVSGSKLNPGLFYISCNILCTAPHH